MSKTLKIDIGLHSFAGIKAENQDTADYCIPDKKSLKSKGIVTTLADGESICEAAKQASETAVNSFISDYYSTPETWSTKKSCRQIINSINSWLYSQGSNQVSRHHDWVTSFDAIIFKSNTAYTVHIGDSRIYRLRKNELSLLTHDHTMHLNDNRTYLSRALGADSSLQIDFNKEPLQEGDIYLQTSNGVHNFLSEDAMIALLKSDEAPQKIAKTIIEKALINYSDDNLSVVVAKVVQLPSESKEEVYNKLFNLPLPPPLEPGKQLDDYEIIETLYQSSRSQIYLAKDLKSDQLLALKMPSAHYRDDPWYLDRFTREEWIGQKLNHPGLMKSVLSENKNYLYFTTEYIEGRTVDQWISAHPTPSFNKVYDYIAQLASALYALHRQDVIHQDLKPENVMIDKLDRIKIIDYGAVQVAGLDELATVLQHQAPEGNLNYTAPEYLMGESGSHRSDIFSLGVICYEMLTGRLPYASRIIDNAQLKSYHQLNYTPLKKHRPDLPAWLDIVLKKACAPNPRNRYEQLSEFVHDLKKPQMTTARIEPEPILEKNPLRFWQAATALLAIALLVSISLL